MKGTQLLGLGWGGVVHWKTVGAVNEVGSMVSEEHLLFLETGSHASAGLEFVT